MNTINEQELKKRLTPEQYHILREKGTERPFTGIYNDFDEPGTYCCGACGNPLFNSDHKFASHCGWPSFDEAIPGSVKYVEDYSHGMHRKEVLCANCSSHLGHIFPDGPTPTRQRYCINSLSLDFEQKP